MDIVFFIACEKYLFWFYRSVGFEGNIKHAIKKGITSAMECADLAAFTFVT